MGSAMTQRVYRLTGVVALFVLGGCSTMATSDYSSRFVGMSNLEGETAYMPRACLAAPLATSDEPSAVHLPPGCANALNLLGMVADPQDLIQGREMGPAYVAPAAAAVERYLGVVADDTVEARHERLVEDSTVSN